MIVIKKKLVVVAILTLVPLGTVLGAEWVTPIYGGTATFNDWGYAGPNGRTAMDFAPINGFGGAAEGNPLDPAGGVGQIQHVVTTGPDYKTPDAPYSVVEDLGGPNLYLDANMDSQVNFYKWGYTTVAGSTFNNMMIDYDGDYLVRREDMAFQYYRTFDYLKDPNGSLPRFVADGEYQNNIQFQPYAISDAAGWCGSVLSSNPGALDAMAGQVTFDFAFEAFFGNKNNPAPGVPGTGSLQIVPDFVMRSYGSLTIDVTLNDGSSLQFTADAVVNNTNPLAGSVNPVTNEKEVGGMGVDEDYYNLVSFMGGGSVPASVYVQLAAGGSYDAAGFKVLNQHEIMGLLNGENIITVYDENGAFLEARDAVTGEVLPNVVLHTNSFAKYPFLLRADGMRVIDALNFDLYGDFSDIPMFAFNEHGDLINLEGAVVQNLSEVPVPPALWLFISGLAWLMGTARRKVS